STCLVAVAGAGLVHRRAPHHRVRIGVAFTSVLEEESVTNSTSKAPARAGDLDWALIVVLLVVGGCLLLWMGGQAASLLTGNGFAAGPVTAGVRALLADRDNPAEAWDSPMPNAPASWWPVWSGSSGFAAG